MVLSRPMRRISSAEAPTLHHTCETFPFRIRFDIDELTGDEMSGGYRSTNGRKGEIVIDDEFRDFLLGSEAQMFVVFQLGIVDRVPRVFVGASNLDGIVVVSLFVLVPDDLHVF